jgi:hypothetical protein
MILDQVDRDDAVRDLLKKLSEVYTFMNGDKKLTEIQGMQALYGKLAQQTLECADFIVHYSKTKSTCELYVLSHWHSSRHPIPVFARSTRPISAWCGQPDAERQGLKIWPIS